MSERVTATVGLFCISSSLVTMRILIDRKGHKSVHVNFGVQTADRY
jgi:hypothetical protein